MEEKKHPKFEEEESVGMVSEPIAGATEAQTAEDITENHDWIDDLDWDKFPILGPKTEEEAVARIDRFEERLAKGEVKWISSEEAWQKLYEKYPWLR